MNKAQWLWMQASVALMRAAAAAMKRDARNADAAKVPSSPLTA
jgi:hypothetical protein